jgi:transglutaminase-like putative cysteine protease
VLFEISHTTVYTYDRPVFFEPHTFRLRPRADFALKPIDFNLVVEPAPAGLTHALDLDGNLVTHAWFTGVSDVLTIKAISKIETSVRNPFGFIVFEPAADKLPLRYSAAMQSLAPYLARPRGRPLGRIGGALGGGGDARVSHHALPSDQRSFAVHGAGRRGGEASG